jgi:CRP/FNR family cyclic AMP-dependent transcriptional regulator
MARSEIDETLARIPIFSECSKKELKEISKLLTSIEISAGQTLTRQGERGNEFMIIERGSASVLRNGVEVGSMQAGDFFGELAMLADAPRTATVVATEDLTVWMLSRPEFSSLLRRSPSIAMNVLTSAVKRLYEDSQRAVE